MVPIEKRFATKYEVVASGCWEWVGSKLGDHGYGGIWRNGRFALAHRVSFEIHVGPIPAGGIICHRCDNPICVNPAHLYAGTTEDNVADRVARNRGFRAAGTRNGHARLTEAAVAEIRRRSATGVRQADLARAYGVSPALICMVVKGQRWTHS